MRMNIEGYIRIGISEQAQRIGDKSTTTLPAPLESKKGRKWTQNESFYPILLVGMNIFLYLCKSNDGYGNNEYYFRYEVLR